MEGIQERRIRIGKERYRTITVYNGKGVAKIIKGVEHRVLYKEEKILILGGS